MRDTRREIDRILLATVTDPIGPEFMAPLGTPARDRGTGREDAAPSAGAHATPSRCDRWPRCAPSDVEAATDDRKHAKQQLVLDELFDLSLYRSLREVASGELQSILDRLIPIEARHSPFGRTSSSCIVERLDLARRLKLRLIVFVCRLLGAPAIHLALEAIEVYGVRKYLRVWTTYADRPLGAAVRSILEDEFEHEDAVVMGTPSDGSIRAASATSFSELERRPGRDRGRRQRLLRRLRQFNAVLAGGRHGGRGGSVVHGRRRLGRDELGGGGPGRPRPGRDGSWARACRQRRGDAPMPRRWWSGRATSPVRLVPVLPVLAGREDGRAVAGRGGEAMIVVRLGDPGLPLRDGDDAQGS
jgi:hypothetical protein